MRLKKFGILLSIATVIVVPSALMIYIAAKPRPPQPTSLYLLNFNKENHTTVPKEQVYLNDLKQNVADVFTEYKKIHPNYEGLNLKFINLNGAPQAGDINFFGQLNRTLKDINPNLSFTMLQRSPTTVQYGFYQKNTDMVSFYWSPDYNGLGTWLAYMFSNSFVVANMWMPLAALLNETDAVLNQPEYTNNPTKSSWPLSLKKKLAEFSVLYPNNNIIPLVDSATNKVITAADILRYSKEFSSNPSVAYTTIQNAISAWANAQNQIGGTIDPADKPPVGLAPGTYSSFHGGLKDYVPSMAINLVNWMSSYLPNIPFVQDGPNTKQIQLVRFGAHAPINQNSSTNYRDWYFDPKQYSNGSNFKWWKESSPFSSSVTPYNGNFSQSNNSDFFSSMQTPLFSWTTVGDYYNEVESGYKTNYEPFLVSQGTTMHTEDFAKIIDSGFTSDPLHGKPEPNGGGYVDIPIRAIPWINASGQTQPYFLSPQDYWAGLKSYERSVNVGLNSNNYFIDLISLNMDKTLSYPANQERNLAPTDNKSFRLFFNKPELTGANIEDILTNSYFAAQPAFSDLVQNIVDDKKFNSIAQLNDGVISIQNTPMEKFYGSGNGYTSWNNLYFSSPYYVSNVTRQNIEFSLNKTFYSAFTNELQDPKEASKYVQYSLNPSLSNGQKVQKFDKITTYYAGGYQEQLTYEQFKINQIDMSKIPSISLAQAFSDFPKSIYEPLIDKLNRSNLIPYNTNIFVAQNDGNIIVKNKQNQTVDNPNIEMDKYGNFDFGENTPEIKSRISPGYYDLIVKNFFTPIDAKDNNGNLLPVLDRSSAIIRSAINNLINWYALTSIVYPSKTESIQNSFMPYGVFNTNTDSNDSRWKYWNIAAYKIGQENVELGKRQGGIIQWTWTELLDQWKQQFSN